MSNQILVPSLGESITEATVSKWLKQIGEQVNSDEPLVELETDKVNVEVPSPSNGTLSTIKVKEGDTVKVGSLLGIVELGKSDSVKISQIDKVDQPDYTPPSKAIKKKNIVREKKQERKKITRESNDEPLALDDELKDKSANGTLVLDTLVDETAKQAEEIEKVEQEKYIPPKTRQHLSPAVRKIVEEKKIDITGIEGTGKAGRVSKGDLIKLMGSIPQSSKRKNSHGPEERVKMTRLRVTIAKRLKEAQDNAAMLTTFNEADMQNIMQMRQDYQEDFQKKYSVKLGYMSFFVKASVVALKNFPAVNAEIENDHIIYKNYYNISIAIGTDRGLVVPVLKKADELSFADIERNIFLLSEKAKQGKITINDLQGGTFTISNGGIYGSMLSTPILNPPQTGILGMHNIIKRPVVEEDNIVIRPIMYLALSYDHRIIDGKEAVSFLKTIKECLEEPRRLFLDL
ncbi:MAG: 2-oxoglutarate dehydrogenase complex dihydrolipoyllysine-residue succinyltransferase [Candidatus Pelagibacterales bacterium]|nr:MAG: 2-oxoglutarate dehydrogenase complex dihydrolipoyllysine-residue succinyltransferase [Pelagibacterales bacterium]